MDKVELSNSGQSDEQLGAAGHVGLDAARPEGRIMRLKDILPVDVVEANISHLTALFASEGYHPDSADLPNAEISEELAEAIRADPGLLRYTEEHGRTDQTGTGI